MDLSRKAGTNTRAALPALRAVVLFTALRAIVLAVAGLAVIATTAFSNEHLAGEALQRVRACTWEAAKVRITGRFGSIETSRPLVEPEGIWCEPIETGRHMGDLPQRIIPWEEIDSVSVGHVHSDTGVLVGTVLGLAGGIAVGFKRTDRELGLAGVIRPFAIALVATPFMLGGGAVGWLLGRNVETWKTCYDGDPAHPALTVESQPRSAADSTVTR